MDSIEKLWVERQDNLSSFSWEISIPVTNFNWKDKVIEFDLEFLKRAKEYGLFYFKENVILNYEDVRRSRISNIMDNYIELLSLRNYFLRNESSAFKWIEENYIDLPLFLDGKFINMPTKYHQPFLNLGILEFENFPGIDLIEVSKNENWESNLHLSIFSSSNIWWQEILCLENVNGKISEFDVPRDNRPWSYRITPRLNSFLRDIKMKTKELGGEYFLEDYNKMYVNEDGILLDGRIVYKEDIDEGRIDLSKIDKGISINSDLN